MVEAPPAQDMFAEAFATVVADENRKQAFARFRAMGLPTTKDEEWRFTSVRQIAETSFVPAQKFSVEPDEFDDWDALDGIRLVFANGYYEGDYSLAERQDGITVTALSIANPVDLGGVADLNHSAFSALNRALYSDGAYVHVPKGVIVEKPIFIVYKFGSGANAEMANARNLYVIEEGAQVSIVELYVGEGSSWMNVVNEGTIGDNAILNHARIQLGSPKAFHTTLQQWRQGRASNASTTTVTFDGQLVRNDTESYLGGEGCEATINGLYVGRGDSHIDNHTKLHHASPHCPSHELFKGVLDDKASAVFNGKIVVDQIAQKTDSKQSNMNLLLSDDAVVNTKPQLEIFADDVRCTHGATIGRLDEDAMFYFRSRGIPKAEAQNLLIYAFASDVIERIRIPGLIEKLEGLLFERFAASK